MKKLKINAILSQIKPKRLEERTKMIKIKKNNKARAMPLH
jgi:hypothetical protein